MGKQKDDLEIFKKIQQMWDVKFPGLRIDVDEFEGNYLIGWKLVNKLGITKSKKESIDKEELNGRWINVDKFKYIVELLEHDFRHWATEKVLEGSV